MTVLGPAWRRLAGLSRFTRPGEATVYVGCGNAGVLRRSLMVIGVSWGVLLEKASKTDTAVRVHVP